MRPPRPPPPPDPGPVVVSIEGWIARAGIPGLCDRVRSVLETSGCGELVICDVAGIAEPDAVIVEALARVQLTARRIGRRIWLRHACGELTDLVALMGLAEVLPVVAGLLVEAGGQAEEREERLRVEEERDPAEPIA
jgi:hypothetical protein